MSDTTTGYTPEAVAHATALLNELRPSDDAVGAALACVALQARQLERETGLRDSLIATAHDEGASYRQIADAAGIDHRTVAAIVGAATG